MLRGWLKRSILPSVFILILGGCSSTVAPVAPTVNSSTGIYRYQLILPNSFVLDSTQGKFMLWVKMIGDTTSVSVLLDSSEFISGSEKYFGNIHLDHNPDSLASAVVSWEPTLDTLAPLHVLLTGSYSSMQNLIPLSSNGVGNLSSLSNGSATATFTTRSSDTNLARNEFYLLRFVHGLPEPSATLPEAPPGWSYGLWAINLNFYPAHRFYYGAFTNSDSADTQPTNTDYPLPGGFNFPKLNDPGATLYVTLEPSFEVTSNRPPGPSPFVILQNRLSEFIEFNDTLPLRNVWPSGGFTGSLTVR